MAPIKKEMLCKDRKYSKQLAPSELETFVDDDSGGSDDDAPKTFNIMTTKNTNKMMLFSEHDFTKANFQATAIMWPEVQMALHLYAFLYAAPIKQLK
jgi:hypothetical protein